jgi:TatD DNase family protein
MAKTYISMGFYIGVGGVITFKNAKKLVETVEQIPLERILVETDSPYLSPEPYRGQRNQSDHIQYVITKIAAIKGISTEEVEAQTAANWKQVFGVEV